MGHGRPLDSPDRDDLVIGLRDDEGLTYRAMAERLGMSAPNAWGLYRRAIGRRETKRAWDERVPVLPNPEDVPFVAWAAGFFDGEGFVYAGIDRGDPRREKDALVVGLAQVVTEPLEAVQARWGGTIRSEMPKHRGRRRLFLWRAYGRNAEPFLREIQPYLRVKHDLVALGLEVIDLMVPKGFRVSEDVRARRTPKLLAIRALNARREHPQRRDVA